MIYGAFRVCLALSSSNEEILFQCLGSYHLADLTFPSSFGLLTMDQQSTTDHIQAGICHHLQITTKSSKFWNCYFANVYKSDHLKKPPPRI